MSPIQQLLKLRKDCSRQVTEWRLDKETFGLCLRQLREDADISLREMARQLELSAAFVSDCELGRRYLSLQHQVRYITYCLK